jgi:integrase
VKAPEKFPFKVRTGSVTVKIYRAEREKDGTKYTSYSISYTAADGQRKLKAFADYSQAYEEAKAVSLKLAQGEIQVAQLSSADRRSYGHALAELKPTGVALEVAAKEYAEAIKILAGRTSLVEAARFYVLKHQDCTPMNVEAAVKQMLETKKREGASLAYQKALKTHLGKLAKSFVGPVAGIGTTEIADFLRGLPVSNRSKKNTRGHLSAFFSFCKERNWIPRHEDPLEHVPTFKAEARDVTVYTPMELVAFLSHARPELVPYLVISAFAGLRSAEVQRLDWSDIALEDGYITVAASKAKTASRRVVPISENLKAWLMPYFKKSGPVVPFKNVPKQLGWLSKDAGIKWKKNALRHSFCSYRLAIVRDSAKVAYEAGNSSNIIYRHYNQLVRSIDAERWFRIESSVGFPQAAPPSSTPADKMSCRRNRTVLPIFR